MIGPGDARWTEFLDTAPHDFYHLPGYATISAGYEGGTPAGVIVDGGSARMLLPLIVRPIRDSGLDATSPYGYPGPILLGAADTGFLDAAFGAVGRALGEQGIVSLFVRFHPLLNDVLPAGPGLVRHGDTVVIDLRLDEQEQWRQTRRDHRSQIRQAIKSGDRAAFDDSVSAFEGFKVLYRETMTRLHAESFYFFDDQYLDSLRALLGDRMRVVTVQVEGELAAACLVTEVNRIVQYHLLGTSERHARRRPSKLIVHFVTGWARERGDRWFHLGGGRGGPNDTLLQFKEGFSHVHRSYHTYRMIIDADAYARLCDQAGQVPDLSLETEFFPLYRKG